MSRAKTNWRTDREQYTRSIAATARPLTLVKPARDSPNTNEWLEMVTSIITFLSTIYRRNIITTGTWQHILRILHTTINDSLYKAHLLTWNKRHWIIVNSYQHRTKDLLTESNKTNYETTTRQLAIWVSINDSLTVTIDGSKRTNDITSLHGL